MSTVRDQGMLDLLADAARGFVRPDGERVRGVRDAGGAVDRKMWKELAAYGWLSIVVPESLGGAGLGVEAAAIVARRLGFAVFPEPFVAAGVLAPLILAASTAAQTPSRLRRLMSGESLVGVAWQGPHGGLEPAECGVERRSHGTGDVLTGVSRFAHVAGAEAYLVAARGEAGVSVHWISPDHSGLELATEHCADGTASATLSLHQVSVGAEELVLTPQRGESVLAEAIDAARVVLSAELIGLMDRVLEMTLEYLRQRRQFDKPIGSFQALQHRAVDIWMQRELSVAALETATRIHDDETTSRRQRVVAASSSKARAAHAAPLVCGEALALHGAIGFTDEYDLGLYINRALALSPWLGGAAEHRRRFSNALPSGR